MSTDISEYKIKTNLALINELTIAITNLSSLYLHLPLILKQVETGFLGNATFHLDKINNLKARIKTLTNILQSS